MGELGIDGFRVTSGYRWRGRKVNPVDVSLQNPPMGS
jgi:hypothetical protein